MKKIVLAVLTAFSACMLQAQNTAKADPTVGPPQFYRNSQLNGGSLFPNTAYTLRVNVKNLINSETVPADGYTVVIKLGTGLLFSGNLASLSPNYTWTADGTTDPTQVILKGVLKNAVDQFYNEDLQVPVTTVSSVISQNYLRTYIQINGAVITANNLTLNDEAGSIYQISGTILPVTFTAFTVEALANCEAKATWQVGTESNVKGYYVEQSTDGVTYKPVAFAAAANQRTYMVKLASPAVGGVSFYRIRQEDRNGDFSYSSVVQTTICRGTKAEWAIMAYPNPLVTQDMVKIKNQNGVFLKPVLVQLIATDGKVMLKRTMQVQQQSQFDLSVKSIPQGVYLLSVATEDESQKAQTFKITVLK